MCEGENQFTTWVKYEARGNVRDGVRLRLAKGLGFQGAPVVGVDSGSGFVFRLGPS